MKKLKILLFAGLIAMMIIPFSLTPVYSVEPCNKRLIDCNYIPKYGWNHSDNPLETDIDSDTIKPTIKKTYNKHHHKYDFDVNHEYSTAEYVVSQKVKKPMSVFDLDHCNYSQWCATSFLNLHW